MKLKIITISVITFFNLTGYSQILERPINDCSKLKQENENYVSEDNYKSWCDFDKKTAYVICQCNFENALERYNSSLKNKIDQFESFIDKRTKLKSESSKYEGKADYLATGIESSDNFETNKQEAITAYQKAIDLKTREKNIARQQYDICRYIRNNCTNQENSIEERINELRERLSKLRDAEPNKQISISPSGSNNNSGLTINKRNSSSSSSSNRSSDSLVTNETEAQKTDRLKIEQLQRQHIENQRKQLSTDQALGQISKGNFDAAAYTFADAGMLDEAMISLGAGIISDVIGGITEARQERIRNYTRFFRNGLESLSEDDEIVRQLFLDGDFEEYLEAESSLREDEEWILNKGDWLYDKTKNGSTRSITNEIRNRRYERLNFISHANVRILESSGLKDLDFVEKLWEFEQAEQDIIKNNKSQIVKERLLNNKILREQKFLADNFETNTYFSNDLWEAIFYLRGDFQNDLFDQKILDFFKNQDYTNRLQLTRAAVYRKRNYVSQVFAPNKIILLLDKGNTLNYYVDLHAYSENEKELPFYKYINDFYGKNVNKLLKSFINKDSKETGKSKKQLFNERKFCSDPSCIVKENIFTNKKILKLNKILSDVNKFIAEGEIKKMKEALKKYITLDNSNVEVYFNLGWVYTELGDLPEAVKYYEKAIEINPNYYGAYRNLSILILSPSNKIVELMNKNLDNPKEYDTLEKNLFTIYINAIPYLEKTNEIKETDDISNILKDIRSKLGIIDQHD